jgi:hypothetical protein
LRVAVGRHRLQLFERLKLRVTITIRWDCFTSEKLALQVFAGAQVPPLT